MSSILFFILLSLNAPADNKPVKVNGASSLAPMFKEMGKDFTKKNGVGINMTAKSSDEAIECVTNKSCDIGLASADSHPEGGNLIVDKLVWDAGTFIVNKKVGVTGVNSAQITDLFNGKIKNWKEIGGADLAVEPIQRKKKHGLRIAFDKQFNLKSTGEEIVSDEAVLNGLAHAKPGGIAYISLADVLSQNRSDIVLLKIDGKEPTVQAATDGSYPFGKRQMVMLRNKEMKDKSAAEFAEFVVQNFKQYAKKFNFIVE